MSLEVSDKVKLLGYRLSDLMSDFYIIHRGEQFIKDERDESWSSDMSGPYKYAVWNNDAFAISEVTNSQLASAIAGGRDPVDAGENIKLYVNDVVTRKKLGDWRVNPAIIRTYIGSCICASSWIVESGANYILRTADDWKKTNLTEAPEGVDPHYVQYLEQKNAMMDVFLRLAEFETIGFGPGSSEASHATLAKVTSSEAQNALVSNLFLEVMENHRKKRIAALSSFMNDVAETEYLKDEAEKAEADKYEAEVKVQAAKQRKNQKKYAKKKAKKQQKTTVTSEGAQDDTRAEGLEGFDAAQFDACKNLWREIMDKTPKKMNPEGNGPEKEAVKAKVDQQEPPRPGTLDAQPVVSWKQAGRDMQDMMAQYGLRNITFVQDKLKSGEIQEGDGLQPFFGLPTSHKWRYSSTTTWRTITREGRI